MWFHEGAIDTYIHHTVSASSFPPSYVCGGLPIIVHTSRTHRFMSMEVTHEFTRDTRSNVLGVLNVKAHVAKSTFVVLL